MHITCEHCGSSINIEKDRVCPGCKAPYSDNKMYKELLLQKEKQRQIDLENKNIDLEIKKNINEVFNKSKKTKTPIFIIAVVIGLFILSINIFITSFANKKEMDSNFDDKFDDKFDNDLNDIFDEKKEIISVNLNEEADNGKYKIKCDEVLINELYDNFDKNKKLKPEKGYKYVTVHILLNNYKNNDYYFVSEVNLLIDGIANENVYDWNRKEIEMQIPANMTKSGYYTFKIKNEEKNYVIRIGNNIEIKVNEEEL